MNCMILTLQKNLKNFLGAYCGAILGGCYAHTCKSILWNELKANHSVIARDLLESRGNLSTMHFLKDSINF